MAVLMKLLVPLAFLVAASDAFASRVARTAHHTSRAHVSIAKIRMMPSPAPAPATKTKTRQVTKPKTGGPSKPAQQKQAVTAKPKLQREDAYVPMWKLLLLGDEEYEEDPVCGVIQEVLGKELNPEEIREKYHEAMARGDSLLTVVNQEHAEAYVSQFHRATPMVFTDAQPE